MKRRSFFASLLAFLCFWRKAEVVAQPMPPLYCIDSETNSVLVVNEDWNRKREESYRQYQQWNPTLEHQREIFEAMRNVRLEEISVVERLGRKGINV